MHVGTSRNIVEASYSTGLRVCFFFLCVERVYVHEYNRSARPLPVDETAVTGMSTGSSCEKKRKIVNGCDSDWYKAFTTNK